MRQGVYGTLETLAREVGRQNDVKKDYVTPSGGLSITSTFYGTTLNSAAGQFSTTESSIMQLGTRIGIPNSYTRTLREKVPYLLDENVNYWLGEHGRNLMVRTLDNTARAFLSDRFKRIDNYPIMDIVMNSILDSDNHDVQVASCDVTNTKMYLKFVSPKLQGDVSVGDPIQMGLAISNSEIGMGALEIKPMIYTLACKNGMVVSQNYGESIRRTHRGERQDIGVLYADDTVRIEGQAMALKVRDIISQLLSPEVFKQHLLKYREAKEQIVTGSVPEAIKELGKAVGYTQDEGEGIMRHLVMGGDLSQYGLMNAVTAYSQEDTVTYDRASKLEEIGGKVLSLNSRQWRNIAEAA